MPNDPNRGVPPDWHIIKLDERQHWRDDLRAKTKAIYSVFAFDASSHTHLCEATPSYALWWIAYDADEDDDRKVVDEIMEGWNTGAWRF